MTAGAGVPSLMHQGILAILHRPQHRLLIGEIGLLFFVLLGADVGVALAAEQVPNARD